MLLFLFQGLFAVYSIIKMYNSESGFVLFIGENSRRLFDAMKGLETEEFKLFVRRLTLAIGIDQLLLASIIFHFFCQKNQGITTVGMILFVISVYFIIDKKSYDNINEKANKYMKFLAIPLVLMAVLWFIRLDVINSFNNDPLVAHCTHYQKEQILNFMISAYKFVRVFTLILFGIALLVKIGISINYFFSDYACSLLKKFIQHCSRIKQKEPHEAFFNWIGLISLIAWPFQMIS